MRFHARWIELVETVLRIHSFRLLLSSTRARALSSCDACLKLGVPVDDIWIEAMRYADLNLFKNGKHLIANDSSRLRAVLDPDRVYDDRPLH